MKPLDSKKRKSCQYLATGLVVVASGGIIRPAHAIFDPVTGGIIAVALGAAITAISSWFSSERKNEVDRQIAAAGYQHDWTVRMLGQTPVTMDIASNAYRNVALTLGLAANVDKFGTRFGLKDGLIYVDRGRYGDTINAKEGILSGSILNQYETIPVPLEPMANNNLTKGESSRIRDMLGKTMDADNIALLSSRRYSLGRQPKQSEANVEMVAFLDKSLPEVNGKPQIKYTYTT